MSGPAWIAIREEPPPRADERVAGCAVFRGVDVQEGELVEGVEAFAAVEGAVMGAQGFGGEEVGVGRAACLRLEFGQVGCAAAVDGVGEELAS